MSIPVAYLGIILIWSATPLAIQWSAQGTGFALAVFVYSGCLVWLKRIGDDSPPLATTVGTLAVALPFFGLVWYLTDGRLPEMIPPRAGAAIVYLGVFGSVIGFALYYYVIKHLETSKVALITLLLGHWLNGESIGLPSGGSAPA
ncbi:MAG: EamA family transporter [Azonexus sp.]|nr:EamA family transporter [Azonexus sp.]